MEAADLMTKIETINEGAIFVDESSGVAWISIRNDRGTTGDFLTKQQAQELIVALTRIVEAI